MRKLGRIFIVSDNLKLEMLKVLPIAPSKGDRKHSIIQQTTHSIHTF